MQTLCKKEKETPKYIHMHLGYYRFAEEVLANIEPMVILKFIKALKFKKIVTENGVSKDDIQSNHKTVCYAGC